MPFPIAIARAAALAESTAVRAGASRAVSQIAARTAAERAAIRPPGLLSRLRGGAWELQTWNELMEKTLPGVLHKITIRAQGSPETNLNSVVHLALATAFGLTPFSPKFLSSATVSVTVDHTANAAVVEFGYKSSATADIISNGLKGIKRQIERSAQLASEGSKKIATAEPDKVKDGAQDLGAAAAPWFVGILGAVIAKSIKSVSPNWNANPGVKNVTPSANGSPPAVGNNQVQQDKRNQENADRRKALDEAEQKASFISGAIGAMTVYRLGRHSIRGGVPFGLLDPGVADRPVPFKDMVGEVILTRDAAANPPPPANRGFDVRTLVAQVLHDPGVRPPLPMTDKGPPVVENEFLGK